MGRRREILKRIAAHERMVAEHEEKIAAELQKSPPDERLIAVWRKQNCKCAGSHCETSTPAHREMSENAAHRGRARVTCTQRPAE